MAAGDKRQPDEMPERLFRQTDDWRHIADVKRRRRREALQAARDRWPWSRVVRTAVMYGAPLAVLVGGYWAGKALFGAAGGMK